VNGPDQPGAPGRSHPDEREVSADQVSLGARLRQPRTILSLVVPLVLLVLIFRVALNVEVGELVDAITRANPLLLLAAFAVFYLGFPLRGLRWALLLRGAGYRLGVRDATEIIFLSWLVNCLVPAKLGDIYRAYLLKINSTVSLSRTFGTVFIERVFDLFAITLLGLAAGFWSFRTGLPVAIQIVFGIGVVVVVLLAAGLLTMRNFGRQIIERLPLPAKVVEFYDRFEEGVFSAIGIRSLPVLGVVTALVWATEASPRDLGRRVRRARRIAHDRRAVHAGRPGSGRGGAVRGAHRRLRGSAGGGDRDHARRPGDQLLLDHRPRLDRLPPVVEATWRGGPRGSDRTGRLPLELTERSGPGRRSYHVPRAAKPRPSSAYRAGPHPSHPADLPDRRHAGVPTGDTGP
jgi:uncharacterized membrane protein YbhN (UPF0104 family)